MKPLNIILKVTRVIKSVSVKQTPENETTGLAFAFAEVGVIPASDLKGRRTTSLPNP